MVHWDVGDSNQAEVGRIVADLEDKVQAVGSEVDNTEEAAAIDLVGLDRKLAALDIVGLVAAVVEL